MNFSTNINLDEVLLRPHRVEDKISFMSTERETKFYQMLGSSMPVTSTREEAEIWFQKKSHPRIRGQLRLIRCVLAA